MSLGGGAAINLSANVSAEGERWNLCRANKRTSKQASEQASSADSPASFFLGFDSLVSWVRFSSKGGHQKKGDSFG
jgi:hypothetical protein